MPDPIHEDAIVKHEYHDETKFSDRVWSFLVAAGTVLSVVVVVWYNSNTSAMNRGDFEARVRALETAVAAQQVSVVELKVQSSSMMAMLANLQKSQDATASDVKILLNRKP